MKLIFCTLFDSNYLTRGLAMYYSLAEHCLDFHLYIFPFDDKCLEILNRLNLDHVTIIPLNDFENDELLKIKNTRTRQEYCWTCTSSTILYVLEHYPVDHCTYIDADLFFFSSPDVLIEEMQDKSVLITEHRYSKENDLSSTSGKYCVQFLTFKNDAKGLRVLKDWIHECKNWCYARFEDNKFGDQKYLDNWMDKYNCVHELKHIGGGVAPWNVRQYKIVKKNRDIFIEKKKGDKLFKLIFYHFHGLIFFKDGIVKLANPIYFLDKSVIKYLYRPYIRKLEEIKQFVLKVDSHFEHFNNNQLADEKPLTLMYILTICIKELVKSFLGINVKKLIKSKRNYFRRSFF